MIAKIKDKELANLILDLNIAKEIFHKLEGKGDTRFNRTIDGYIGGVMALLQAFGNTKNLTEPQRAFAKKLIRNSKNFSKKN